MGNPGANVLATPILGLFFEHAATEALEGRLEDGMGTLGVRLLINHKAATPVGMKLTITAELIEVDGRRLRFRIEARDEVESVGEGEHDRVIVNWQRFLESVGERSEQNRDKQGPLR